MVAAILGIVGQLAMPGVCHTTTAYFSFRPPPTPAFFPWIETVASSRLHDDAETPNANAPMIRKQDRNGYCNHMVVVDKMLLLVCKSQADSCQIRGHVISRLSLLVEQFVRQPTPDTPIVGQTKGF